MSARRRFLADLFPVVAFSLWPFLAFADHNWNEVLNLRAIAAYALTTLALALGMVFVIRWLFGRHNTVRCSNLVAVACILIFSYGIIDLALKDLGFFRHRYVLLAWTMLALATWALTWFVFKGPRSSLVLSVVGAVVLVIPLGGLTVQGLKTGGGQGLAGVSQTTSQSETAWRPNVYFFVMDSYARAAVLSSVAGFDNRAFLESMRERGFYVAGESLANYPVTFLSISTTLNMDYLVAPGGGAVVGDQQRYALIIGGFNDTVRGFKRLGYRYVHVQSGGWIGDVPCSVEKGEAGMVGLRG